MTYGNHSCSSRQTLRELVITLFSRMAVLVPRYPLCHMDPFNKIVTNHTENVSWLRQVNAKSWTLHSNLCLEEKHQSTYLRQWLNHPHHIHSDEENLTHGATRLLKRGVMRIQETSQPGLQAFFP